MYHTLQGNCCLIKKLHAESVLGEASTHSEPVTSHGFNEINQRLLPAFLAPLQSVVVVAFSLAMIVTNL